MKEYDFNKLLSPLDFELLSRDLIQRELDIIFESFKEGRDQGIDFKFSTFISTNSIVLQCKNYKDDYSYFFRNLKEELEKVKKLNPQRYMITTSVSLTNANKEEIKEYFEPYILKTSDIYGGNDLNNLLSKPENNDIEKQHSKLWLASINILERVLHSNIHCQSEMLLEEIEWKVPFFVYSQNYEESLNILHKERCCIISGNPGVGKTTLAYMLLLEFIKNEENFEIIEIKSFDEANKVWNKDKKQIFYFDDFLGKNFRTIKLDKNEDSNIARLMKRVSRYENKYIIFTTREYILNQAKHDYEALSGGDFELTKMIIDINRYSNKIKAEILYNHLHFSSLPDEYVYELLENNSFLEIINHKNYNPRIVEHLTDIRLLSKFDIAVKEYREYFLENLNNPIKIWSDIFENDKISFEAKILIYVLFVESINRPNGSYIRTFEEDFFKLYDFYVNLGVCKKQESIFEKVLKELDNSFIRIYEDSYKKNLINFYDPSINDFLLQYLDTHTDILIDVIEGLDLFSSGYTIQYKLSNIINFSNQKNTMRITFHAKLKEIFIKKMNMDSTISIIDLHFLDSVLTDNKLVNNKLNKKIKSIIENFYLYDNDEGLNLDKIPKKYVYFHHEIETVYEYYQLATKYNIQKYTNQQLYEFCLYRIQAGSLSSELYNFTYMCEIEGIRRKRKKETAYIKDFITNFLEMVDELDELNQIDDWDEEYSYSFNLDFWDDRFRNKYEELSTTIAEGNEETNKNVLSTKDVDIKEVINLFNGLRE